MVKIMVKSLKKNYPILQRGVEWTIGISPFGKILPKKEH
jgi:hypothetical protein